MFWASHCTGCRPHAHPAAGGQILTCIVSRTCTTIMAACGLFAAAAVLLLLRCAGLAVGSRYKYLIIPGQQCEGALPAQLDPAQSGTWTGQHSTPGRTCTVSSCRY